MAQQTFRYMREVVILEPNTRFTIKCSMIQIYKSDLVDLFRSDEALFVPLTIVEDDNGIRVKGATEIHAENFLAEKGADQLIRIFNRGLDSRMMRSTDANETSSRSHLLFTLHVESVDFRTPGLKKSKITFIDLAGSERLALIGFSDFLYEEALFINESLRCLERVIKYLTLNVPHESVDFHGNLLTHLIKDIIGGESKTILVVCIAPSIFDIEATMDTLKFAARTGKIKAQQGLIPDQAKMSEEFLAYKMIKSIK